MKKWECTVCGYIHAGEEPPEICPVCGADKSKFIEVTDTEEKKETTGAQAKPSSESQEKESRETKSSGEKTKSGEKQPPAEKTFRENLYAVSTRLILKHHAHPVSVHVPNGMLPASVLFVFLAVIFDFYQLELASYYNIIFVLLVMPVVMFTGYVEWKKHYGGNLTTIFIIKISSAIVVLLSVLIVVIWRTANPEIALVDSPGRMIYLGVWVVMLAAAGVAGYFGGKLVFKD
jgi:rubredoxin/uncharacterized membrane protein